MRLPLEGFGGVKNCRGKGLVGGFAQCGKVYFVRFTLVMQCFFVFVNRLQLLKYFLSSPSEIVDIGLGLGPRRRDN